MTVEGIPDTEFGVNVVDDSMRWSSDEQTCMPCLLYYPRAVALPSSSHINTSFRVPAHRSRRKNNNKYQRLCPPSRVLVYLLVSKSLTHEIKCNIIIGSFRVACIKCTRCPAVAMLGGNVTGWASNCGCLKPSPACNANMIAPPVNKNCWV